MFPWKVLNFQETGYLASEWHKHPVMQQWGLIDNKSVIFKKLDLKLAFRFWDLFFDPIQYLAEEIFIQFDLLALVLF